MRVDNDVLAVLSRADLNGNALVLTGQLDRKLYERTNKVLEAAGGKWNGKAKAHIFDIDASDRIEQIILTGDILIPKDEFEFFPTPSDVVQLVHEASGVQPGMTILEPSAGRAALIEGLQGLDIKVTAVEMMPANAEYLRGLGWLHSVVSSDFLAVQPTQDFDRVLMNPPFGRQADIKHVLHALKFLKSTGLLVAVMAAGVEFRENKLTSDFRALVTQRGGSIKALPDGAFKQSGTMVRTVLVTIPQSV